MFGQRIREFLVGGQGDGSALVSSGAQTSILPASAKITIPSQYLQQPGLIFDLYLAGRISTLNPTPGTFQLSFRMGAVDAFASGALALNTAAAKTNVAWEARLRATVRIIGTAAQLFGQWSLTSEAFANALPTGVGMLLGPASAPALGTAFDATAQQTIDVTAQFGTSSASNSVTLHQYHLESA